MVNSTPTVIITNETSVIISFDTAAFSHQALSLLNIDTGTIELTFVHDEAIIDLHTHYLNKASTTDIITFNLGSPGAIEADIYICVDEAQRNADHLKHSLDYELKTLILHGLLHVLGYNDHDEPSKAKMFAEQDRLLNLIGDQP